MEEKGKNMTAPPDGKTKMEAMAGAKRQKSDDDSSIDSSSDDQAENFRKRQKTK